MLEYLDRIGAKLSDLGLRTSECLQPGLRPEEIAAIENDLPLHFTDELRELYGWRNGTVVEKSDSLGDIHFLPLFYFLSIEEALEIYRVYRNSDEWKHSWFPIFSDDGGDFLVAECSKENTSTSPVIYYFHDDPEKTAEYQSITAMMQTLDSAFDEGAFFLDADGWIDQHEDQYREIARRFSPRLDIWKA